MSYYLFVVYYFVFVIIINCIRLYMYDCYLVFIIFYFLMFERMILDVVSVGTMVILVRVVVNVVVFFYSVFVLFVTVGVKRFGLGTLNR